MIKQEIQNLLEYNYAVYKSERHILGN